MCIYVYICIYIYLSIYIYIYAKEQRIICWKMWQQGIRTLLCWREWEVGSVNINNFIELRKDMTWQLCPSYTCLECWTPVAADSSNCMNFTDGFEEQQKESTRHWFLWKGIGTFPLFHLLSLAIHTRLHYERVTGREKAPLADRGPTKVLMVPTCTINLVPSVSTSSQKGNDFHLSDKNVSQTSDASHLHMVIG